MKTTILSTLALLLLITNCTVQKRHYRKGYEVSFNKTKTNTAKKEHALTKNTELLGNNDYELNNKELTNEVTATTENRITEPKKTFKTLIVEKRTSDSCDVIKLRNGTTVTAKVLEINATEIKYKNCNNINGPLMIIDKNTAQSITYGNGFNEEFTATEKPIEPEKNKQPTQQHKAQSDEYDGYSIASLVCGVLGFIFVLPAIAAIILGKIGERKTKENGTKGKVLALVGKILGWIVVGFIILFLLLFIVALGSI